MRSPAFMAIDFQPVWKLCSALGTNPRASAGLTVSSRSLSLGLALNSSEMRGYFLRRNLLMAMWADHFAGSSSEIIVGVELGCRPRVKGRQSVCAVERIRTRKESIFAKSKPVELIQEV